MPNVERFCTYKQSLDYVRRYCPFLTAREKDLILGDTCAAFYGIGRQRVAGEAQESEPNGRRGCAQPSLPTWPSSRAQHLLPSFSRHAA